MTASTGGNVGLIVEDKKPDGTPDFKESALIGAVGTTATKSMDIANDCNSNEVKPSVGTYPLKFEFD